jgi:hypothetical protein
MTREPENRKRPRVHHPFMVRYRRPGETLWSVSPLKDLSGGGARFIAEGQIPDQTIFELQLLLPTAAQPVWVKARVTWVKQLRQGLMTELGVTFTPDDIAGQHAIDTAVDHYRNKEQA